MPETLAIVAMVFCASVINGMSGFGFMLVLVPTLSLFLGPVDGVIVANVVSPFQGVTMFLLLRRHVVWRTLTAMLVAAAIGMPFGIYLLLTLPTGAIRVTIAVSVLAGALAMWRGFDFRYEGRPAEAVVGFLSGVLKTGAGINGPPVVLYLQGVRLEAMPFRATLSAYFLVSNLAAVLTIVAAGAVTAERALNSLVAIPFLIAGALAGNRIYSYLDPVLFRRVVLSLLVAGAVVTIWSASFD